MSEDAADVVGSAPSGYRLNTCDPEVLLLLRADGSRVAALSARGATATSIRNAAEDDLGAMGRVGGGGISAQDSGPP